MEYIAFSNLLTQFLATRKINLRSSNLVYMATCQLGMLGNRRLVIRYHSTREVKERALKITKLIIEQQVVL